MRTLGEGRNCITIALLSLPNFCQCSRGKAVDDNGHINGRNQIVRAYHRNDYP